MSPTTFDLKGTPQQNEIIRNALARTQFPFHLLLPKLKADTGRDLIPAEWEDLSRYAAALEAQKSKGGHAHIHEDGDTGHPIEMRERVLGLAWYSGKVTVDESLVNNPELAKEVFLSEGAHMIDFFYMTDAHREALFNALHGGEEAPAEHGHGWFDVGGYRSWAGEAFMGLFVRAFSDVQMTIPFDHPPTPYAIGRAREILLPEPEIKPNPDMAPYFATRSGKVFHDKHGRIPREATFTSYAEAEASGRRPCKTCKPQPEHG